MGLNSALVLGFDESLLQAQGLAEAAGLAFAEVHVHRFPDGESLVRVPQRLPDDVILYRSLDRPNNKLVELMFAAAAAREQGVRRLILVAPYLCYMRQDTAFHPGEAVSQRIVGGLLASRFDGIVTVDPHLHRVARLEDAVPAKSTLLLTAAPSMGDFLDAEVPDALLVGPDAESLQWVSRVAAAHRLDYLIGSKERLGDRSVRIHFDGADCRGRHLVLVDDVVSTGRTLEVATLELVSYRPASISVLITHALFADGSDRRLMAAGVDHVWSTDSIPHASNRLPLAQMLADALPDCFSGEKSLKGGRAQYSS